MRGPEIAVDHPADTDRIFTLPNIISLLRLAGIPLFVWVLFGLDRRVAAAFVLAFVAGTDWIDGGLARRWNQVTSLGKVLDPTIDRALLLVASIAAVVDHSMPLWLGVFLATREVLVGIAGIGLALLGARRIAVTWWGKVYAFGVMWSLPFFFIGNTDSFWATPAEIIAWVTIVPSAIMSWVTAVRYVPKGREALRAGKN